MNTPRADHHDYKDYYNAAISITLVRMLRRLPLKGIPHKLPSRCFMKFLNDEYNS